MTTVVGQTVIFHCRVRSRGFFPPTIKWYKKHENYPFHQVNEGTTRSVTYLNITYDLIREGDQKQLANDLYLSKLILPGITVQDSGVYGCVALNYGGFQQQEAFLKVNFPLGDPMKVGNNSQEIRNFFWLFFIPFSLFIVLPFIIYMWLHTYKKHCKMDARPKEKPLGSDSSSNRWVARPSNAKNPYLMVNLDIV